MEKKDTYTYNFIVGGIPVHCGKTIDLKRREEEHRREKGWEKGRIHQVGNITTDTAARAWEKKNNCNK